MRSHPYQAPPPLPPIIDDIVSFLPNQNIPADDSHSERSGFAEDGVPLERLDPDTSTLLPRKKKRHHVRVQGRLALVRSVSAVNLNAHSQATATGSVASPHDACPNGRYESAVGSVASRRSSRFFSAVQTPQARRRSLDDVGETDSDTEEDERAVISVRDRQFRGYGIGGAGNIRRPTEVVDFSSRRLSSMMLFSSVAASKSDRPERRRWNLMSFLGRATDRKGKGVAATTT